MSNDDSDAYPVSRFVLLFFFFLSELVFFFFCKKCPFSWVWGLRWSFKTWCNLNLEGDGRMQCVVLHCKAEVIYN